MVLFVGQLATMCPKTIHLKHFLLEVLMDLCLLLCGFEGDLRKPHGLKVEQGSHVESWIH